MIQPLRVNNVDKHPVHDSALLFISVPRWLLPPVLSLLAFYFGNTFMGMIH